MQKFGINAYSRRSWTSNDQDIPSMNEDNSNEIHNGSDSSAGGAGGYQDSSQTGPSSSSGALATLPEQHQPQQPHHGNPLPSYMNSSPARSQSGHIGRPRGASNKVDINLFKQLVTRKVPVGEIASEFGISRLAVYYHMHKLGFKPYMRPGRARGRGGGLPGNRGAGVTMGLSTSGGLGFGGSSFGVRGSASNVMPGFPPRGANLPSGSNSLNDTDPLGAFQHPNLHRSFFETSPGGLPTMVGYSNMGRFPGFAGSGVGGGGAGVAPPAGGGVGGGGGAGDGVGVGGGDEGNGYSDEEVEGNLDDIKIEEEAEMEDDVIGEDDATGSGLGEEEEDEEEGGGGQNHVDNLAALEDAFP